MFLTIIALNTFSVFEIAVNVVCANDSCRSRAPWASTQIFAINGCIVPQTQRRV